MAKCGFATIMFVLLQLSSPAKPLQDYDYLIYENVDAMREIFGKEQTSLGDLRDLLTSLRASHTAVSAYLGSIPEIPRDDDDYYGNPINVYTGLRNIAIKGSDARRLMRAAKDVENRTKIALEAVLEKDFPTRRELHAATRGLLFLFDTYQIDWAAAASEGMFRVFIVMQLSKKCVMIHWVKGQVRVTSLWRNPM